MAGKCDLTARQGDVLWIIDVKSGQPRASDQAQVMIYMHLFPKARRELQGLTIKGLLVYGDHEEVIEPEEVDGQFVQAFDSLVRRLGRHRGTGGEGAVLVRVPVLRHQQPGLPRSGWSRRTGRWEPRTDFSCRPWRATVSTRGRNKLTAGLTTSCKAWKLPRLSQGRKRPKSGVALKTGRAVSRFKALPMTALVVGSPSNTEPGGPVSKGAFFATIHQEPGAAQ